MIDTKLDSCPRCNDRLDDIEDFDLHNACHDYMERQQYQGQREPEWFPGTVGTHYAGVRFAQAEKREK